MDRKPQQWLHFVLKFFKMCKLCTLWYARWVQGTCRHAFSLFSISVCLIHGTWPSPSSRYKAPVLSSTAIGTTQQAEIFPISQPLPRLDPYFFTDILNHKFSLYSYLRKCSLQVKSHWKKPHRYCFHENTTAAYQEMKSTLTWRTSLMLTS